MTNKSHWQKLEGMYQSAPIVRELFPASIIEVGDGVATITLPMEERFFHAAGGLHGSVYFRMLDDAAYFAVNSMEMEYFMLTAQFDIQFIRPVNKGIITAKGTVMNQSESAIKASATLHDASGELISKGEGIFVRSKSPLSSIEGYR